MKFTDNYQLNLPDKADQFNLEHWNQNTEKLDEKLKSIDDLTNDGLKKSLLNFIYPVGSLYWSSKSTNPAELFGGTWTQIKDKFILAAGDTYVNGSTGGSDSITLTEANLPSHTHSLNNHTHSFSATTGGTGKHSHAVTIGINSMTGGGTGSSMNRNKEGTMVSFDFSKGYTSTQTGDHSHSVSGTTGGASGNTTATGSGTAFSNMPPYIGKYCWERIE